MSDCFCDYDTPEFYAKSNPVARKQGRCSECGHAINPGETYERVAGKWRGTFDTFKTCPRCLALKEYVQAHVPCCCWAHGNIIDDAIETIREYAHETTGLLFGAYRLLVKINRSPRIGA